MVVTIPGMRILSTANRREHHMEKARRARKAMADTGMMLLAASGRPPWDSSIVEMTRIAPRPQDSDNLAHSFKAQRDAVALYLGVDDGDTDRLLFVYRQERGDWAARIEIMEWDKSKCHECGHKLVER